HLGLFRPEIADTASQRGGAAQNAERRLVSGRAGQLRAAGAAACRAGPRRWPAGDRLLRRRRCAEGDELARAEAQGRRAHAASEDAGRAIRRPRRGLSAQHPRNHDRVSRDREPDMAAPAVIDRFKQIEPKVLIACDSVVYAGRKHDRRNVVQELQRSLPTVEHLILHSDTAGTDRLSNILAATGAETDAFEPEWLPFDHPLWIVYSSGTTGLPKPIVHGHGGVMIVGLPLNVLHNDIGCSYAEVSRGERYHWYSSTGWIMWNCQVSGLLNGTTCCIFDGSPGGSKDKPDWLTLWRFVADAKATFFGAGAAFFANCTKAEIDL